MKVAILGLLVWSVAPGPAPRVGIIEFYGLKGVSRARLEQQLGFKVGDPLPPSKANVEQQLLSVDGVAASRLEAVCCEGDTAIVFVGIEEKGAPHFDFHPEPASNATLPDEIRGAYEGSLLAYEESARKGEAALELRAWEAKFVDLGAAHTKQIHEVLRTSLDADQRAIAAHVIAFGPDKQAAAVDLQYALRDPDSGVRRAALRSLGTLASYTSSHPEAEIKIPPTWPVEMLYSIVWSDRTGAVDLLLTLSESRDARVLELVRDRALLPLLEMAAWKSLVHALPAFLLLGRVAGWPQERIHEAWSGGGREKQLAALEKSLRTGK